jgi:hypothetical protein
VLINLSIDLAKIEFWIHSANIEIIINIVKAALLIELSLFRSDMTIFYHAKDSTFALLDIATKAAGIFPQEIDFKSINPFDANFSDEGVPCIKSINYSLFRGFGSIGESTLHYLCFNFSQSR